MCNWAEVESCSYTSRALAPVKTCFLFNRLVGVRLLECSCVARIAAGGQTIHRVTQRSTGAVEPVVVSVHRP